MFLIGIFFYLFLNSKYYNIIFPNTSFFFTIRPIPISYIYSLFGFFLFPINIVDKLKKYQKKTILIFSIIFFLFLDYNNLYGKNIHFYIIKALGCINIFILFLILPFYKIHNNIVIYFIKLITSYTGGIYYLHTQCQLILEYYFTRMKSKTIKVCIINYLFCYFICLIGSKLFGRSKLKLLFI